MKQKKSLSLLLALSLLLCLLCPQVALANSGEPPCFTVLVLNAPEDLSVSLILGDETVEPVLLKQDTQAWESYYRFYYGMSGWEREDEEEWLADAALLVETGETEYTCALPAEAFDYYNNLLTLDVEEQTLAQGQPVWRQPLLVGLRIVLTLVLEGLVFFLFGYRSRRSWAIFLVVNLVTQILLNIAIVSAALSGGYWLFLYGFGELLIFAAEIAAFTLTLKEQGRGRAAACALSANVVSLLAGGWVLANLPV